MISWVSINTLCSRNDNIFVNALFYQKQIAYINVFIITNCWWVYKIQIALYITCNLYRQIPHNNTLSSLLLTIRIIYRFRGLGHPRERHDKTHAISPTRIPQPGLRLVGGCAANQSEARPENPHQPTRIGPSRSSTPEMIHTTVLGYLCTFAISLHTLNVWNMQCGGKFISTLRYTGLQIRAVCAVRLPDMLTSAAIAFGKTSNTTAQA